MDFSMFPYGNAKTSGSGPWTFTCQHGKNECIGNMYEACAIAHYNTTTNNVPTWWPMVNCMESATDPVAAAQGCATNNGIAWSTITACAGADPANGDPNDGNKVMNAVGVATNTLVPPHQWTPWVVLNGKPLTSAQLDLPLKTLVCNAYTGTKPAGCTVADEPVSKMLDRREN